MRLRTWSAALVALAFVSASCSVNDLAGPKKLDPSLRGLAAVAAPSTALPAVRVSEFHYDNASTDIDEKVEISGPAGIDLTGWQLVLYNGAPASRAPYTTTSLKDLIPATCGDRGVLVISYPSNGIQNGDPDGMALVKPNGNVVEFISYGGSFVAASGPAVGMKSTDIGIKEAGTEPTNPVSSLQMDVNGVWSKNAAHVNTFGACNDNGATAPATGEVATITLSPALATINSGGSQLFTASAFDADNQQLVDAEYTWSVSPTSTASVNGNGFVTAIQPGDVQVTATAANGVAGTATLHVNVTAPLPTTHFSEIHYDNVGEDKDEAIEIEGPAGTNLDGWHIVLYNGNGGAVYNTVDLSGAIPASCGARGVVVTTYPVNGIQNGPDAIALVNGTTVVQFLSYEGSFTASDGPAAGMVSTDIGVSENSAPVGQSLQLLTSGLWSQPFASTFGACNGDGGAAAGRSISFSGRLSSDPSLPVGFEDQLFATEHDGANTVATTFTWSSATPDLASIDADGVMHAFAAGTATFVATAADGTAASYSLPMAVATASTTALYGGNTEFGEPTDADASDDFIIRRPEYTTSFNKNRNTPNWVSYDLDPTHFGSNVDRCDCFTHDPALPSDFTHLNTADYTGAGAAAGYGIDRGHLARSFDRTSGTLDNATTYYLSNIIPQAADLNQGPWAIMENYLGDLARNQNKEVYIIAGVAGSKGTVKSEGKITIPQKVWKVAVILPHDEGLADIHDYRDLQVIAVIMPNDPGIKSVDWQTYETTVDNVEAVSGYDLLALLPDKIERAVESNTQPPVAVLNGAYSSNEGSLVSLNGSGSFDGSGTIVDYSWNFGDGSIGNGQSVTHTYAQDGAYTVRLIVSDNLGVADTSFTAASVTNVSPSVAPYTGATLLPGETYTANGSFTDPGADAWSATVNYGDGSATETLILNGKSFTLAHTYVAQGTFTVTVRVADDDVTSSQTQSVTVLSAAQALTQAGTLIGELAADAGLNSGIENSLRSKLAAAQKQIAAGNTTAASNQLQALLNEIDAMTRSGRVSASSAQDLVTMVTRVIRSITP
jgi:DNA/RNA endonuclease G (NUC1)